MFEQSFEQKIYFIVPAPSPSLGCMLKSPVVNSKTKITVHESHPGPVMTGFQGGIAVCESEVQLPFFKGPESTKKKD